MRQWGCSYLVDLSLFVTATTVTFSKVKSEFNFSEMEREIDE